MKKYFIIIAIVGFFLYLPSLFGPFLWDDEDFVYANQYVKEFRIDKFFTDSQTAGRGKASNYYRPIPQISYATTNLIFGMNPFWFHLLNVTVHIAAACTIFYFINQLTKNSTISLLTSLIFLVHPVQTEAVSYISGLSDPLFVLFGFLALIYLQKNKIWWSLGFFALSVLSKETGLVFLPLIIILNWKKSWSFVVFAFCYLTFHFSFINSVDMKSVWGDNPYANSILVRLLTFVQNMFTYISLLLFPKDLFMERDYSVSIQTNILNIFLLMFILINSVIVFFIRKSKLLLFCFLAFYLTFIPYTGIILINGIFYEHFLYLPMVFFFAFWLVIFQKYLKNKYILYVLFGILVLFGLRNIVRQFDWNDSIRFYSQTLERAPKSIRIINGLGMAYAEKGDVSNSITAYKRGIKIDPLVPNLYHNLGNIYASAGKLDEAEKNYLKALEVSPNFIFSAQSLANLYQQTGQTKKMENFLKTIQN